MFEIRLEYRKSRKTYGSPKIHKQLKKRGIAVGKNRIARLMQLHGLRSRRKRKFKVTTDSCHSFSVAPNRLARAFDVQGPNRVWLSDITYVSTQEGWLYCCTVMDLGTRKIIGWSLKPRMTQSLVIDALRMAYRRRRPGKGLIFHSDRGSQYACHAVRKLLTKWGFKQSMSAKGDCWDNAPMESFFGSMKTEWIYGRRYPTRLEAKNAVFNYIEGFYNPIRIHHSLGDMSPNEYEQAIMKSVA